MIGIIDYGMGNLNSVAKAVEQVGAQSRFVRLPGELDSVDKIILPGVGAFEDAMRFLNASGIVDPLLEKIRSGVPFLGICLGMQMLFERSFENGVFSGLGLFAGDVVRFDFSQTMRDSAGEKLSIPHMGWNQVSIEQPHHPFWRGVEPSTYFYFVHSYHVLPTDSTCVASYTEYGYPFCSAVCRDNVMATQFHPEKSQADGLKLLRNFATF
ncbi:MAG: imidazole glycerol phosphate synthase subunit HisH [Planctomycetia bacterium]|nr:imidazole glycerol phosphate synthase subunit HisH [Planctomycetia bacterium]